MSLPRRGLCASSVTPARRWPVLVLAVFAALSCFAVPAQGAKDVLAVPKVGVVAHQISFHGDSALLVRSITVSHIAKTQLRVTCEHCVRYPTPIRETKPKPGTKRFAGVNWIIVLGRHIHVSVTRRGAIGRYLVLGVGKARRQGSLLVTGSGCIGQDLKAIPCPRHVRSPSKGSHVKGGSPKALDAVAPSTPGGLSVSGVTETTIGVKWTASSDNVGVAGYALLRDGSRVASTPAGTTSFGFTGLSCGHAYRLGVAAYDAAGNLSTAATVTVSTAACPPSDRMSHEESLLAAASQYLQSPDGRFRFVMQADGNVVLYGPSGALWSTNTIGKKARELRMQNDGNLVLYDQNSQGIWSSETGRHYNAFVVVQNDGNVVIYEGGTALWSTGTGGKT
jgi:Fibronectin type III domain